MSDNADNSVYDTQAALYDATGCGRVTAAELLGVWRLRNGPRRVATRCVRRGHAAQAIEPAHLHCGLTATVIDQQRGKSRLELQTWKCAHDFVDGLMIEAARIDDVGAGAGSDQLCLVRLMSRIFGTYVVRDEALNANSASKSSRCASRLRAPNR